MNAQHGRICGIKQYVQSRNIQASQASIQVIQYIFNVLGTIDTHLAFALPLSISRDPLVFACTDHCLLRSRLTPRFFPFRPLFWQQPHPSLVHIHHRNEFLRYCGIATQSPLSVSFLSSRNYLCLIIWVLSTCLIFSLPSFFLFLRRILRF